MNGSLDISLHSKIPLGSDSPTHLCRGNLTKFTASEKQTHLNIYQQHGQRRGCRERWADERGNERRRRGSLWVRMWLIYTSDRRGHCGDVRVRDKTLPRWGPRSCHTDAAAHSHGGFKYTERSTFVLTERDSGALLFFKRWLLKDENRYPNDSVFSRSVQRGQIKEKVSGETVTTVSAFNSGGIHMTC